MRMLLLRLRPPSCYRRMDVKNSSIRFFSTHHQDEELMKRYNLMTSMGDVQEDEHQIMAIQQLERLRNDLLQRYQPPELISPIPKQKEESSSSSVLGSLFGGTSSSTTTTPRLAKPKPPKGVYLHGGVGCGKTMVMNLFYDSIVGTDWEHDKQKVHFHKFMLGIHQQMHEAKMVQGMEGDVLEFVIQNTLQRGRLLCFDEFQVTDVADALILRRLFTGLLQEGAVVVATSNRPPDDLYLNGLQRDLFLPFIDLLKEKLVVVSMWDSDTDYRLIQAQHNRAARSVYFVGKQEWNDFDKAFYQLVNQLAVSSTHLTTLNRRHVAVPMACLEAGICRLTFEDVCQKALGAADYLIIGQTFHTVFLERVPKLTRDEINWVRRFITFVDTMYECHVKLVVHAASPINEIFMVDLNDPNTDEVFAFDRTQSRLQEMSSNAYLRKRWAGGKRLDLKAELNVEPSLSQDVVKEQQ